MLEQGQALGATLYLSAFPSIPCNTAHLRAGSGRLSRHGVMEEEAEDAAH